MPVENTEKLIVWVVAVVDECVFRDEAGEDLFLRTGCGFPLEELPVQGDCVARPEIFHREAKAAGKLRTKLLVEGYAPRAAFTRTTPPIGTLAVVVEPEWPTAVSFHSHAPRPDLNDLALVTVTSAFHPNLLTNCQRLRVHTFIIPNCRREQGSSHDYF